MAFTKTYLVPDFPELKLIGMVRDQRSNYRGRFFHSTLAVHDSKLNKTDAIVLRRRAYYEVCNLLYNGSSNVTAPGGPDCQRVVRVEDLHDRHEEVMRSFAAFLGIDFVPSMLVSTFGGLTFWGDEIYGMEPMNRVNPRVVSNSWQAKLPALDWFVIEGLFYDYMKAYGYPLYKYTEDSWPNRIKLFFLMILPSEFERRIFIDYLKPSTIRAFIEACLSEADGRTPLKDYSFNAYYRHRWGMEDLKLWVPRWYVRFLEYTREIAAGTRSGLVAGLVGGAGKWTYVAANTGRYIWAVIACPGWIIKRWGLSCDAYHRLISKNDYMPPKLP